MVRTRDLTINPAYVVSMEWDRRWYANGPGDSVLVIRMHGGHEHRIKHEPHLMGGTDAYKVEAAILAAHERAAA
jgi:hypothetical protein